MKQTPSRIHKSFFLSAFITALFFIVITFQGCSDSGSKTASSDAPTKQTSPTPVPTIETKIQFVRLKSSPNGQSFKVQVNRAGITPSFITQITVARAGSSITGWSQVDPNTIEATVSPVSGNPTGYYPITITTSDGKQFQRTPIVLANMANRWNQPELFASPINSEGWQDSPQAFVAKDASGNESLLMAMVYLAVPFKCGHGPNGSAGLNAGNPDCLKAVGPVGGDSRPLFNLGSFVNSSGDINELLPNLLPGIPVSWPDSNQPTGTGYLPGKTGATLYVFKFESDSYPGYLGTPKTNPQALYIAGDDGLSTLSSPYIYKNGSGYSLLYNNDTFSDSQSSCHGYVGDVGSDTGIDPLIIGNYDINASSVELGHYNAVLPGGHFSTGATNTHNQPCPELIKSNVHVSNGLPLAGLQGNPTFYFPTTGQPVAFWDLEGSHQGVLQMAVLANGQTFPGTGVNSWNMVNTPLPILAAPPKPGNYQYEKSQPVLTESEFCYRNEYNRGIDCAPYNGGDPTLAASYGAPVLQMAGVASSMADQIVAVGEPSLFTFQGMKCMSFASLNQKTADAYSMHLQIGWVCE